MSNFHPNPRYIAKGTMDQRRRALTDLLGLVSRRMDATARAAGCKSKADFVKWAEAQAKVG